MAHRVALMYAGQIIEVAPAAEFFAAPRHPYAQALLRALPDAGRRGQPLEAIAGTVPPLTQAASRLPLRAALRAGDAALRGSTPPGAGAATRHEVRCLLYDGGLRRARAPDSPARRAPRRAATRQAQAADGELRRPPVPLLEVQDLRVRFPMRGGLLQRARGFFDAVARRVLRGAPGRRWPGGRVGLRQDDHRQGHRAAAARPALIEGQALLDGRNLFDAAGRRAARGAARGADHLPGPVRLAEPAHAGARHPGGRPARAAARARRRRAAAHRHAWWTRWACAATRSSATRTSSPAASASASPSRARWRCSRG
jgi:peptide/nickel transport system ATP-binding protein